MEDPDYLLWISRADFSPEVQEIVNKALYGEFPKPPEPSESVEDEF